MITRALDRARDPRVEWVVGRLEREQEERVAPVIGAGELRFERVEEPAVGGVQARLRDRAGRVDTTRTDAGRTVDGQRSGRRDRS